MKTKIESRITKAASNGYLSNIGTEAKAKRTAAGNRYLENENVRSPTSTTLMIIARRNSFLKGKVERNRSARPPITTARGETIIFLECTSRFAAARRKPLGPKVKLSVSAGGLAGSKL